jgi:transposase
MRPTLISPSAAFDAPGYKCHATLVDAEAFMEVLRRKTSEPKRYFMWRRIATRYDKLARNFLAATTLVGALYWIKL